MKEQSWRPGGALLIFSLGLSCAPAPVLGFQGVDHGAMTKVILKRLGYNLKSRELVAEENKATDKDPAEKNLPKAHFDNEQLKEGSERVRQRLNSAITNLDRCLVKKALADLGRALHTVQDFYAHSNYAEKASLRTVSIDLLNITQNPDPGEKCYNNERFADFTTGYYPMGVEYKLRLPDKCNHDDNKARNKKGLSKDALGPTDPFFRLARDAALKDTNRIVKAWEQEFTTKCGGGARCQLLLRQFQNLDPKDDVKQSCSSR